jgi:outer membrane lipoprotein carrier protein
MTSNRLALASFVATVACAATLAPAATALHAQQPGASAEELARTLQQRYDKVFDFRASFVQTTRGGVLRIQSPRGEGTVAVKKPGKMRWDYTKPEPQLIVSDGKRIYDYDPVTKDVTIAEMPPADQAPTAALVLAGKGDILRDYTVTKVESPVPGTQALRLDPRKADPDYEYLVIAFDPASYQIRGLMTRDSQGGESTIVFSNIRQNSNIPDKTFTPPRS